MSEDYASDEWILNMFEGWFDPCPLNPDWEKNGLSPQVEWGRKTYENPPYSDPLPWVKRAIAESKGGKMVVMLLKHDTSTRWYSLLHQAGAKFLMVSGRLKYQTRRQAAFPSILAILDGVNVK